MEEQKRISVVMCTYNGERFLREQLQSIVKQTYPILELIIVDDGSTDNTLGIIKSFQKDYETIKCFQNKNNLGAHRNFLNAYIKASGDYIVPSDQDDIWMPNKIEVLTSLIGDKLFVHSQSKILYEDGSFQNSFGLRNPFVSITELVWDNKFPGHAGMFKKDILDYMQFALSLYESDKIVIQSNAHDHVAPIVSFSMDSYAITDEILQTWRRHANVCNLQFVHKNDTKINQVKSKNGYMKFLLALILLLRGKKSTPIYETFYSRSILLGYINLKNKTIENKNLLLLLKKQTRYISEQTFISYIKAGYISVKLLDKTKFKNLKDQLGKSSYAFRYPFLYLYDMHKVPYL
jgi:glycosyltransferase involved in cell wall biosynthesis